MVKIQIDGTTYEVKPGKNLLETCLSLGFDIPYFCFHPTLGSVGACRLCAVKKYANSNDKTGRIVMSCMEPAVDGLIISVADPEVKSFRASILESLMTNHPHDCPVCDEGGECHLQDMTVMTGHNYRRFDFKKRTHKNQNLGPFIHHEMNRCIQCYRCVRFYRDYAGGKDLNVFGSANNVYFGRHEEGTLESEFSGNLAEICPTGVFTDKTLKKHFTRKWDLTNAPSICVHCSIGCNTIASERYGSLRRVVNRYNGDVNGYLLCDRGRFGYEFVNSTKRIKKPQIRQSKGSTLEVKEVSEIIPKLSEALRSKNLVGIGSPRASLEANFALSKLVGAENFYHGVSDKEYHLTKLCLQILSSGAAHSPSLKEVEKADAIFILGEDVTNTAPMLALAIRQATRNKSIEKAEKIGIPKWNDAAVRELAQNIHSPLFIASPYFTKLDELAEITYRATSEDIARLGFAVASYISNNAPSVDNLNIDIQNQAKRIADALKQSKNPLIVIGIQGNEEIAHATANIALSLKSIDKKPSLSIALPESNSIGLGMMEGKPFRELKIENNTTLVILENDLYLRVEKSIVDELLEKCQNIVVLDQLMNETSAKADILIPTGTFAESEGTLVNNEGRAQRYYSVYPAVEPIRESWRWIVELMRIQGKSEGVSWQKFDDVVNSMAISHPIFSKIKEYLPNADFRMFNEKISRQTMRFSGRTAMNSNISVHEQKPPQDADSPLAFSMEGYQGVPPSSLTPFHWAPGWNSNQAANKYMVEPNGELKGGNPGIRLIENTTDQQQSYYKNIPQPFKPSDEGVFIVPVHQIFGSEELSSNGEALSSRISEPFIKVNLKEATRYSLKGNDTVHLTVENIDVLVKVDIDASIPDGVAGLSFNLPRMPFISLPKIGIIKKS